MAVAGSAAADYSCQHGKDTLVFAPAGEAEAGLIFYPGGKVEHTAYAPLMEQQQQTAMAFGEILQEE